MKPDYKNWMPKGMILSFAACATVFLLLFVAFAFAGLLGAGTMQIVPIIIFAALAVIFCGITAWANHLYRAFDYSGKRQLSRQIIGGIAEYVKLPNNGKCLDVGCGSGALTIAVAKRNPNASIIGIDRWGKEYASYNQKLCESNASAEKVDNVSFRKGNAVHLDFPDETFDAVTSNYVYQNIPGDRQQYLLETLRTLKKGGTFAIHDTFSASKYGDMQAFLKKLKAMGYEKVVLINTADGIFMKKREAICLGLSNSALLIGKK